MSTYHSNQYYPYGFEDCHEKVCIDIEDTWKCAKCKAKLREGSGTK
jgi:hypothetical protein